MSQKRKMGVRPPAPPSSHSDNTPMQANDLTPLSGRAKHRRRTSGGASSMTGTTPLGRASPTSPTPLRPAPPALESRTDDGTATSIVTEESGGESMLTAAAHDDDDVFAAPAASAPAPADDYDRIMSQLESALACVTLLERRPGQPAYPARAKELLRALNASILDPAQPQQPSNHRTSYRDAARKGTATSRTAPVPPRAAKPVSHSNSEARRPGRPSAPESDPSVRANCIVLRWAATDRPTHQEPPAGITSSLNSALSIGGSPCIRGVNWSRNGNLVLHVQPPFTPSQVTSARQFHAALQKAVGHGERPSVDESGEWHGVVVNGIPGPELWQAYRAGFEDMVHVGSIMFDLAGVDRNAVKDVKVLCSEDAMGTLESYSVRFMLGSPGVARQLRQEGFFAFGTHCRVTGYRPRRGRRAKADGAQP